MYTKRIVRLIVEMFQRSKSFLKRYGWDKAGQPDHIHHMFQFLELTRNSIKFFRRV